MLITVLFPAMQGATAMAKSNPKYASLVMDADTGRILSQRYADHKRYPASLTKMMTMLMIFEALDRGQVTKRTRIRISRHAASMVPSKLGLPVGSTIRIEDAIKSLATKSANDIAVAVAEHLGRTESQFAVKMTQRARQIGMKNTRYRNASGLHNRYQVTTARDQAKLARYILKRHPHHYKYFSTRNFSYKGKNYRNHNRLLESYRGMDGFKTGYINASGFNLVASANQNGRRLIGVVFGGKSGKSRNEHMASIMDAGFKKVKSRKIHHAAFDPPPIPAHKPVYGVARMATNTARPAAQAATSDQVAYASLASLRKKPQTPIHASALTTLLENSEMDKITGEGSVETVNSRRLEAAMLAMNKHTNRVIHENTDLAMARSLEPKSGGDEITERLAHPRDVIGKWSIQIGAYTSRLKTDNNLRAAKNKLPANLAHANVMTVPLNTDKGMVFRARLGGMNEAQAKQACDYFTDCITIAPLATRVSSQ